MTTVVGSTSVEIRVVITVVGSTSVVVVVTLHMVSIEVLKCIE